jgi:hypothetical protein
MKKTVLIAAMLVAFAQSCALFNSGSTTEAKAKDIENLSYAAASAGTSIALQQNPAWRPKFADAFNTLNTLVNGKAITGELLRQIVASLPVKELKSDTARIAIQSATILFDQSVGTSINVESAPYVMAAARGIRNGMGVALGVPITELSPIVAPPPPSAPVIQPPTTQLPVPRRYASAMFLERP